MNDELQDLIVQLDPNNIGWAVYGDVVYELATMLLQLVTQNTLQVHLRLCVCVCVFCICIVSICMIYTCVRGHSW